MQIDQVLLGVIVLLSACLGIGILQLAHENPILFGSFGNYRWDKVVKIFEPSRNLSIFEDPEDENV